MFMYYIYTYNKARKHIKKIIRKIIHLKYFTVFTDTISLFTK